VLAVREHSDFVVEHGDDGFFVVALLFLRTTCLPAKRGSK
jgi:hypothetical protein